MRIYSRSICYFQGERGYPGDSGCINLRLEKGQMGDPGFPGEHGLRGERGKFIKESPAHIHIPLT